MPTKPYQPEFDTIVVPARETTFQQICIAENWWHHVHIQDAKIPTIKYIAFYRVAPISAITHLAPVQSIEPWKNTDKYALNFLEPPQEISPLRLQPNGRVKPLYGRRYTTRDKILSAKTLDDVF